MYTKKKLQICAKSFANLHQILNHTNSKKMQISHDVQQIIVGLFISRQSGTCFDIWITLERTGGFYGVSTPNFKSIRF